MIQRVDHRRRRGARVIRLQMPPDAHRSTLCDHVVCGGDDGPTSSGIPTARTSRSSRRRAITSTRVLRVADAATGAVRDVLEETVATQFESGNGCVELARAAGVERGDLVLASATTGASSISTISTTGKLKNQITTGEGNVDAARARRREDAHALVRRASARSGARSVLPAFLPHRHRRQGPDAAHAGERAITTITLSPSGSYFVDTYSTPDVPPVDRAARRERQGRDARSRRPTSRGSSRRAGSRRCRSR